MIKSFATYLKEQAKKIIPDEIEYRTGLTPRPKPMTFKVGEGLSPEGKAKAEQTVRKVNITPFPTFKSRLNIPEAVTAKAVIKELPYGVKKTFEGIKKLPGFLAPAMSNVAKTQLGIIGEGLAYGLNKNVREQYKKGNVDILPLVSKTGVKENVLDSVAAGIEATVFKYVPVAMKQTLVNRFGLGALQGIGFAISSGIARDKTVEQIMEDAKSYAKFGGAINVVAPYLIPLLKSELKNIPAELKASLRGLAEESKQITPGMTIRDVNLPVDIPSILKPLAKKVDDLKITKEKFIKNFDDGIKANNPIAIRLSKEIENTGNSLESFYNLIKPKTGTPLEGMPKSLRKFDTETGRPSGGTDMLKAGQPITQSYLTAKKAVIKPLSDTIDKQVAIDFIKRAELLESSGKLKPVHSGIIKVELKKAKEGFTNELDEWVPKFEKDLQEKAIKDIAETKIEKAKYGEKIQSEINRKTKSQIEKEIKDIDKELVVLRERTSDYMRGNRKINTMANANNQVKIEKSLQRKDFLEDVIKEINQTPTAKPVSKLPAEYEIAKEYKSLNKFLDAFSNKNYNNLNAWNKEVYSKIIHPTEGGFKYNGKTIRDAKADIIKKFGNTERAVKEYNKIDVLFEKYQVEKLTDIYKKATQTKSIAKPVSKIESTTYRQMHSEDINTILRGGNPSQSAQTFYATNKEMAIGQGASAKLNPVVEFAKKDIPMLSEYKGKPALDFTGGELVGLNKSIDVPGGITGKHLLDNINKIIFKKGTMSERSNVMLADKLELLGWKKAIMGNEISFIKPVSKLSDNNLLREKYVSKTEGTNDYTVREPKDLYNSPVAIKYKKEGFVTFANQKISSPADVAFAFKQLKNEAVEKFYVVGLKGNKPVTVECVSVGTLNASLVHPREIFGLLLKNKIDGVYFIHNHPSGNIEPSEDDISVTSRLTGIAKNFGIDFKGHIIIDSNKFGFIDKSTPGDYSKSFIKEITHHDKAIDPKKISLYKKYAEWTADKPTDFVISKPDEAYELIKGLNLDKKNNALVLHLNARNVVITAQAIPKNALKHNEIFEQTTKFQSASVIMVNTGLKGSEVTELSREFTKYGVNLLDVVEQSKGTIKFVSRSEQGFIREGVEKYKAKKKTYLEDKKKFVDSFLKSEEGAKVYEQIEINIAKNESIGKVNKDIISGIVNSPYFRKEKSISDIMANGILMKKGNRSMISGTKDVERYEANGWKRGLEIDSLAQEAGFVNGEAYLNYTLEQIQKNSSLTSPQKIAHNTLTETDESYKALNEEINLLTKQINEKFEKEIGATTRPQKKEVSRILKATESKKEPIKETLLLTTPNIEGEGFVMKGKPKRKGFTPKVRLKKEIEKSIKDMADKKIAAEALATAKKSLSGFDNFIDITKVEIKDIPYKEMNIAERIVGDKEYPAIRKSGFYATKEIQTAPVLDIYSQNLSPHLMALKQDGYKLGGKFGEVFSKIWKPTENAIRVEKEFSSKNVKAILDLGKKYKIKADKKNLEHLSDVIEKKVVATPNEELYIAELRKTLDGLRDQANVVREAMGKNRMGYIENYIPHIQKANIWSELLSNEATISDNLDFIIPNQTKNPFAYKRMLEEMVEPERNLYILLDRYISVIGKDIYYTPAIENIKAYNGVLKGREKIKAAQYWDEYIRQGLVGKQHKIDSSIGIGMKGQKVLKKWNDMVNKAFLTGKVAWNLATQPLSFMMPGMAEIGVKNSVKGIYKGFNKGLRQYVKENSNVLNIKNSDVHAIAVGEGRNIQNRIYRTKVDKYNDFISMIGAIEERELTMASYLGGLERAKELGYKGKDALWFADLSAAKSQSMYNRENRALILNSDITRTIFPFQSFSIEMFNHAKEIFTKTGGAYSLNGRQRLGKLFGLLVGLYLANKYSELLTGRKKSSLGTFIPFLGGTVVDPMIAKMKGEQFYGGRSPITVIQIGEDIIKGSKDYIKHGSTKRLRKIGVNFGLALGGMGGGGQINNLIDGIMANIDGDVKNVKGETMFEVKDAISKIKAPIFGVWATKEGSEYFDKPTKSEEIIKKSSSKILTSKETDTVRQSIKKDLEDKKITVKEAVAIIRKLAKNQLPENQMKVKVKKIFNEIKNASPEEKKKALQGLNEEERKEFLRLIRESVD